MLGAGAPVRTATVSARASGSQPAMVSTGALSPQSATTDREAPSSRPAMLGAGAPAHTTSARDLTVRDQGRSAREPLCATGDDRQGTHGPATSDGRHGSPRPAMAAGESSDSPPAMPGAKTARLATSEARRGSGRTAVVDGRTATPGLATSDARCGSPRPAPLMLGAEAPVRNQRRSATSTGSQVARAARVGIRAPAHEAPASHPRDSSGRSGPHRELQDRTP